MLSSLFSEQTCPRCGAKAPYDAVSCPICGYWLHPTNYLPVLMVVILVALLDIGLIVLRGVPRSALAISASELPPVATVAPPSPVAIVMATSSPTLVLVPTETATPVDTPPTMPTSTATTAPTVVPSATATSVPTATAISVAEASPRVEATRSVARVGEASFVSLDLAQAPTATAAPTVVEPTVSATTVILPPTVGPTATPANGRLWIRNYIGSELVFTVTSQDMVWATTFRVAPMGETTIDLMPGHYTFTASPPGGEDEHGEFDLAAGLKVELPITGQ